MNSQDPVERAGLESFPASDSPAWGCTAEETAPRDPSSNELTELFAAIKKSQGKVPDVYTTLGSNPPALFAHLMQLNSVIQSDGSLGKEELEAINLAVEAWLDRMRAAGYTDAQFVDVIGAATAILFANLLDRTNDTFLYSPG